MKKFRIAFCIVCMNRLHHLKKTLLQNIKDNEDYLDLEFIIINYNSRDGMDEWIKENFEQYISSGKIVYYRTPDPETFSHSHSKNLAFTLASGDILCNINADHFTGPGFAKYVNGQFNKYDRMVLTTVDYFKVKTDYNPSKDVFGKVCVRKEDFLRVRGFDERMDHYGFEDWDFVNRLELDGCRRVFIEDFSYLNFIPHGEEERYTLKKDGEDLKGIYINYLSSSLSGLLFLYTNNTYHKGTVVDNYAIRSNDYRSAYLPPEKRFEFNLVEEFWTKGVWQKNGDDLFVLSNGTGHEIIMQFCQGIKELRELESGNMFYLLEDSDTQNSLLSFNYFYNNRSIMERNLEQKQVMVNTNNRYGQAMVYKNYGLNNTSHHNEKLQ